MSNNIIGYNNIKKIIEGENNILNEKIEITFFKFVYYRYNYFNREYIINRIENKSFGDTIHFLIKNISDYIGKIYINLILPEIKIEREYKKLLIIKQNYNIFFTIFDSYIKDVNILIKFLTHINKIYNYNYIKNFEFDYTNVINNNTNTYNNNYINNTYLKLNNYISTTYDNINHFDNNFIHVNEYKNINIIGNSINNSSELTNNIQSIIYIIKNQNKTNSEIKELINNLIINILHNIKFIYKNIYEKYIENKKNIKNFKYYKFSWIDNIGYYIFNNIKFKFNNDTIFILYNDWLSIWNELNNNKINIKQYNKLNGNKEELTSFNSEPKPESNLIINLPLFFNNISNLYLPLLFNNNNIYLELNLEKIENCINIDENWKKDNPTENLNEIIKIKNLSINIENIIISLDEKKNIIKNNDYKNIINIIEKKELLIPIKNFKSKPYIFKKKFLIDKPINEIYITIQSNNLSNNNNLKNNYKGFSKLSHENLNTTNKINILEYCNILSHLELYINNEKINSIINAENLELINTYKYYKSHMNGLYIYNFNLYPFNNQPSGHINLNVNSIFIKFTFESTFIEYLEYLYNKNNIVVNSNYNEEQIKINIFFNVNKMLKFQNGNYKVI